MSPENKKESEQLKLEFYLELSKANLALTQCQCVLNHTNIDQYVSEDEFRSSRYMLDEMIKNISDLKQWYI